METFTKDMFELRKARIVDCDEGAELGVKGGLRGLDGLRVKGTGNLLGDKGRGITSIEEGLGEVGGVGVEVIWGGCKCAYHEWLGKKV